MHFNFKMHILNFANFDRYLSKVVVPVYSYTKILQSVASLYPGQHRVSSDILANDKLIIRESCFLALLVFI